MSRKFSEGNIIIVDKYDKQISTKKRSLIRSDDIYRVSALWIADKMGNVLLAKRASTKKNDPGKWGPTVAGTIEEGETYTTNILKEAEEELGIFDISPEQGPKIFNKGKHLHFTQWFFFTRDYYISDLKINSEEVAEVKWFIKDELLILLKEQPAMFLDGASTWVKFINKSK